MTLSVKSFMIYLMKTYNIYFRLKGRLDNAYVTSTTERDARVHLEYRFKGACITHVVCVG